MTEFRAYAKEYQDAEQMASDYLVLYFGNNKIEYPINPFEMLRSEGVLFDIANFKKLEGVYIPPASSSDIPIVGINYNRPITRQRFTAAHELCHHFRDSNKQVTCPIGSRDAIEIFADRFAAAVLMPINELRAQVIKRKNKRGNISFDDVLEISDFFGVSFESCLYRIAYRIHAIEGDTEHSELKKRVNRFCPDKKRKACHMSYSELYAGLIDNLQEQMSFYPSDHAKYVFQNEYIYNDSRMEGLNVTIEQASEIVTDLRLNAQHSDYCKEENEAYLSIAGHYAMYQDIFSNPLMEKVNIYETIRLNKKLFSYYPNPDFGGQTRNNNTLVLGAKFETIDYMDIYPELAKVDSEIKQTIADFKNESLSEYIKSVARIHHRITVIHPFSEGNGRTSRAFMNVQLISAGLPPIYIRAEDKKEYVEALSSADKTGDYDDLYEIIFRMVLKSHVELKEL